MGYILFVSVTRSMLTRCGLNVTPSHFFKIRADALPFFLWKYAKSSMKTLNTNRLQFMNIQSISQNYFNKIHFYFYFEKVIQFSSVQSLSRVWLFATPWIAACQASVSITKSRSLLKLMSIESVMPSSHLILYRPLLLLPPIPPSIRVFSNESTLHMRWPNHWSFTLASFLPKKSQGWSPWKWTGWISLQSKGLSRVFSNTTVQKHQFFSAQPSSQSNSHIVWTR